MNGTLNEIRRIQKSDFKIPWSDISFIILFHFLISAFALGKIEILKNIVNQISEQSPWETIGRYVILLVAATGLTALLRYAMARYLEWRRTEVFGRCVCMMMDRNLAMSSWKDSHSGTQDRYLLMTKEIRGFVDSIYRSIPDFIAWLTLIPLFAVYLGTVSVTALSVVIAVEVAVWKFSDKIQRLLPELNRDRREKYGKWMGYLTRTFGNYDIMRNGVSRKKYEEVFDRKAFCWNDSSREGLNKLLTMDQIQNAGGITIETVLLLIGVLGLLSGRYEVGGVYALVASVQTIKKKLAEMPEMVEAIYETQSHYQMLEEFCIKNKFEGEEFSGGDTGGKRSACGLFNTLELRSVNFGYGNRKLIIRGFNYTFCKGGLYAVVGPAGTGKTTILLLMAGFLQETGGVLYYNGNSMRELGRDSLWKRLIYVSKPCFIKGTVKENVRFGRETFDEKLYGEIERDDSLLLGRVLESEEGGSFSAGEKQRILIYRALCSGCDIMLLDEPFSNLDKAMEIRMIELMRQVVQSGKCIVITTHRGAVLDSCAGIISMESVQG